MIADYNTYIGLGDENLGVERNKVNCGHKLPYIFRRPAPSPGFPI